MPLPSPAKSSRPASLWERSPTRRGIRRRGVPASGYSARLSPDAVGRGGSGRDRQGAPVAALLITQLARSDFILTIGRRLSGRIPGIGGYLLRPSSNVEFLLRMTSRRGRAGKFRVRELPGLVHRTQSAAAPDHSRRGRGCLSDGAARPDDYRDGSAADGAKALKVLLPLAMNLAITTYILALAPSSSRSPAGSPTVSGARRVFVSALAIFTIGSVLCGMAQNFPTLIVTRALQGFGGAMMTPVGRLILIRSFPRSQLVTAMTYMTLPAILGPVIRASPARRRALLTYLSWRLGVLRQYPVRPYRHPDGAALPRGHQKRPGGEVRFSRLPDGGNRLLPVRIRHREYRAADDPAGRGRWRVWSWRWRCSRGSCFPRGGSRRRRSISRCSGSAPSLSRRCLAASAAVGYKRRRAVSWLPLMLQGGVRPQARWSPGGLTFVSAAELRSSSGRCARAARSGGSASRSC